MSGPLVQGLKNPSLLLVSSRCGRPRLYLTGPVSVVSLLVLKLTAIKRKGMTSENKQSRGQVIITSRTKACPLCAHHRHPRGPASAPAGCSLHCLPASPPHLSSSATSQGSYLDSLMAPTPLPKPPMVPMGLLLLAGLLLSLLCDPVVNVCPPCQTPRSGRGETRGIFVLCCVP